jgi:outer membrane murein-binding lipoprotein Lpp
MRRSSCDAVEGSDRRALVQECGRTMPGMDWLGVDLRRMGTAMLVFGILGVVVATIVAIGMFGTAWSARNLDQRIADEQAYVVDALARVDSTVGKLVTSTENGATTLGTTSDTLATAEGVLGQVAGTAKELSTSIDISILGSRPLAGAAQRFAELATSVEGFQAKAAALSQNLATNASDVQDLAGQIDVLRDDLQSVSERVAGFEATSTLVSLLVASFVMLGLLVTWLAVAALAVAWAGLRLRRIGTAVAHTTAPGVTVPDPEEVA